MAELLANSELVVGEWIGSPELRAAIDALTDTIREDVLPSFDTLEVMRRVDDADGVWLDFLGVRVGIRRPSTTDPSLDTRFGFVAADGTTQAGVGFDQRPFRGPAANDAIYPLPDVIYRRMVKARGLLDLGDGTIQTFGKAVRYIDPSAAVQDRRNMVVRIVTALRPFIELADEIGALPRTGGVDLIYADRGRFGFAAADDTSRSGVGFDQGAFRPASGA